MPHHGSLGHRCCTGCVHYYGNVVLSAYWTAGYSESQDKSRWRLYLEDEISGTTVEDEHFAGARPEYSRAPNGSVVDAISELRGT